MKKIFLLFPFFMLVLNAEMMGETESGNFISNKDRSEINELISEEKEAREKPITIKKEVEPEKVNPKIASIIEDEIIDENDLSNEEEFEVKDLEPAVKLAPQKKIKKKKEAKAEYNDDDGMAIGEGEGSSFNKIKLRQYTIRYDHSYDNYSFETPTKETFNKYLKMKKINKSRFNNMLDSDQNLETVRMSALYYDFYMGRPDYAENFYKIIYKKRKNLKMGDILLLADYILRTGRADKLHTVIEKKMCSSSFKKSVRGQCFFYLGIDNFLRTGKRKNKYIRIAKDKSKKAKLFYKGKI